MFTNAHKWFVAVALVFGGSCGAESPIRPGDRIALIGNTYADQLRIHGYLETLLLQRTSEKPVSVRNFGWAGDMLHARDRPTNFPSEESSLKEHLTDVIIACFGMGESFSGEKGLQAFRVNLERFLQSHRGKIYNGVSEVRLVLISPIACEDLGELTPRRQELNASLERYSNLMSEVANKHRLPFVDLFTPSKYQMERGGRKFTVNGVRLDAYGYWATSRWVVDRLLPASSGWHLQLDAREGSAVGQGVRIAKVVAENGGLSFEVKEERAPSALPPQGEPAHESLGKQLDRLQVRNLAAGNYVLTIDGKAIDTFLSSDLARGVILKSTPAHDALEAYREAVNDKNQQFTYSWKALNQVHIVGERKKSNSGRALPEEVKAFRQLGVEKEAALRRGIQLKARLWKLVRQSDDSRK